VTIKRSGKVANLEAAVASSGMDLALTLENHVGIAHTRWATHGPPNEVNCHPHQSNARREFTVVHNGIITNAQSLRGFLEKRGYSFVSETDTESIAVLIQYIYDEQKKVSLFASPWLCVCVGGGGQPMMMGVCSCVSFVHSPDHKSSSPHCPR
jgi:glucosamine 6-phosphate synthetase-like amidotransferase/phosphosugar isomerase protein